MLDLLRRARATNVGLTHAKASAGMGRCRNHRRSSGPERLTACLWQIIGGSHQDRPSSDAFDVTRVAVCLAIVGWRWRRPLSSPLWAKVTCDVHRLGPCRFGRGFPPPPRWTNCGERSIHPPPRQSSPHDGRSLIDDEGPRGLRWPMVLDEAAHCDLIDKVKGHARRLGGHRGAGRSPEGHHAVCAVV